VYCRTTLPPIQMQVFSVSFPCKWRGFFLTVQNRNQSPFLRYGFGLATEKTMLATTPFGLVLLYDFIVPPPPLMQLDSSKMNFDGLFARYDGDGGFASHYCLTQTRKCRPPSCDRVPRQRHKL